MLNTALWRKTNKTVCKQSKPKRFILYFPSRGNVQRLPGNKAKVCTVVASEDKCLNTECTPTLLLFFSRTFCWLWCHMIWNTTFDILGHLSWLRLLKASDYRQPTGLLERELKRWPLCWASTANKNKTFMYYQYHSCDNYGEQIGGLMRWNLTPAQEDPHTILLPITAQSSPTAPSKKLPSE